MAEKDKDILENIGEQEYKYGFTTDIETETIGKGLNEEVVRLISAKKGEPAWMTERRVAAYRHWLTLEPPVWAHLTIPEIDFQDIIYYAAPKPQKKLNSMDEVDPELKRTFDKLGIPLEEQMALAGVAVDAVMDSVSVKTTFKEVLAEKGIIFCSISEALRRLSRPGEEIPGQRRPLYRQFLCGTQCCGLLRRFVLLHPQGCPLSDGTVDLFPYQCGWDGTVRTYADRGRRRGLRELPRRLYGPAPRREPAACRRGRDHCREGRRGQILHGAELVSRRQAGAGRHL